jgi:hypothetical protein
MSVLARLASVPDGFAGHPGRFANARVSRRSASLNKRKRRNFSAQAQAEGGMDDRRARAFQTTGPAERWLKSLIAATDFTRRAIFASK